MGGGHKIFVAEIGGVAILLTPTFVNLGWAGTYKTCKPETDGQSGDLGGNACLLVCFFINLCVAFVCRTLFTFFSIFLSLDRKIWA